MQRLGLPAALAQRFWSTKSLWLIVIHPEDIQRVHLADLRGRYSPRGLDENGTGSMTSDYNIIAPSRCLTVELRAVYASLPTSFLFDADGRKGLWKVELRQQLQRAASESPAK